MESIFRMSKNLLSKCIKNQQSLAKSVLKFVNRIREDQLCLSIEIVVHLSLLLKSTKYDSEYYRNHLETICDAFDCSSLIASVCIQHTESVKLLADSDLQKNMISIGRNLVDSQICYYEFNESSSITFCMCE